jgi:hypothetical protein
VREDAVVALRAAQGLLQPCPGGGPGLRALVEEAVEAGGVPDPARLHPGTLGEARYVERVVGDPDDDARAAGEIGHAIRQVVQAEGLVGGQVVPPAHRSLTSVELAELD